VSVGRLTPTAGGELARALRTLGRRDEQSVLRQADARGLAGLLRDAREAREEPNAFPEITALLRRFEAGGMGLGNRCCVRFTVEPPDQSVQRGHYKQEKS
jgi:hypothetical protein